MVRLESLNWQEACVAPRRISKSQILSSGRVILELCLNLFSFFSGGNSETRLWLQSVIWRFRQAIGQ